MAKRIICFIFFLLISFSSLSLCASASYEPDFSRSDVKAYYLYNPENNLYMAEHGADKVIAPAATVKMMTAEKTTDDPPAFSFPAKRNITKNDTRSVA